MRYRYMCRSLLDWKAKRKRPLLSCCLAWSMFYLPGKSSPQNQSQNDCHCLVWIQTSESSKSLLIDCYLWLRPICLRYGRSWSWQVLYQTRSFAVSVKQSPFRNHWKGQYAMDGLCKGNSLYGTTNHTHIQTASYHRETIIDGVYEHGALKYLVLTELAQFNKSLTLARAFFFACLLLCSVRYLSGETWFEHQPKSFFLKMKSIDKITNLMLKSLDK